MERVLDVRGLSCPVPLVEARRALAAMRAGDVLVVLATDPEAPIDIAAMAADEGHGFAVSEGGRMVVTVAAGPASGGAPTAAG
jgi:tRNA 2-thiouridine synthesizing protein A